MSILSHLLPPRILNVPTQARRSRQNIISKLPSEQKARFLRSIWLRYWNKKPVYKALSRLKLFCHHIPHGPCSLQIKASCYSVHIEYFTCEIQMWMFFLIQVLMDSHSKVLLHHMSQTLPYTCSFQLCLECD